MKNEIKDLAIGCIKVGMCYKDYKVIADKEEAETGSLFTVTPARYLELIYEYEYNNEVGFIVW